MIYLIVFAISLVMNFVTYGNPKYRNITYNGLLLFLFLFTAYRMNVGCDYGSYWTHAKFHQTETLVQVLQKVETLYWLTVIGLYRLGFEFPTINVVSAVIFYAGIHALARRQPDRLLFLTLIYPMLITNLAMSAVRQAAALGFLCFAYNAVTDRKPLRFVLFVLLAFGFHKSALGFLALTFFISKDTSPRVLLLAGLATLPFLYFFFTNSAAQQYSDMYVNTATDAAGGAYRALSLFLTGVIFFLFLRKKWKIQTPVDYDLIFYTAPIMLFIFPVAFYSSVIGDRFGYYLMPLQAVILSRAYLYYNKIDSFIMYLFPIAMFGSMLLIWSQYSQIFQECYGVYDYWVPWNLPPKPY